MSPKSHDLSRENMHTCTHSSTAAGNPKEKIRGWWGCGKPLSGPLRLFASGFQWQGQKEKQSRPCFPAWCHLAEGPAHTSAPICCCEGPLLWAPLGAAWGGVGWGSKCSWPRPTPGRIVDQAIPCMSPSSLVAPSSWNPEPRSWEAHAISLSISMVCHLREGACDGNSVSLFFLFLSLWPCFIKELG